MQIIKHIEKISYAAVHAIYNISLCQHTNGRIDYMLENHWNGPISAPYFSARQTRYKNWLVLIVSYLFQISPF